LITLAFDVYGTLIDTNGVVTALENQIGDKAQQFSNTWRDKQLEYSFRRGLMRDYRNFAVCTADALDYTCSYYGIELNDVQKHSLLSIYRELPPFKDVMVGLRQVHSKGYCIYAFSNGLKKAVERLLVNAGINDYFSGIVSVDKLKTFKPNPDVYHLFMKQAEVEAEEAWMISGNPFDVIGAMATGMKAAWVKRSPEAVFDPWGVEPTITVNNLLELDKGIQDFNTSHKRTRRYS